MQPPAGHDGRFSDAGHIVMFMPVIFLMPLMAERSPVLQVVHDIDHLGTDRRIRSSRLQGMIEDW